MPRKAKRSGPPTPNTVQRSAVQPRQNLPNAVPTGLPFGEHQALQQQQSQIPLPNTADRLQTAIDAANNSSPGPDYGQMLGQPTQLPDEPVTAGLPMGPGPGPESLQPTIIPPPSIDDAAMARYLPMMEMLADQPWASNATRNYVRTMRGSLPPGITMESIVKNPPGGVAPLPGSHRG